MDQIGIQIPAKVERRSHAERIEQSDSAMLDACIDLIVKQGTEKTTLKSVGELAGYSRGLAGARFKSKSGLFSFVIKQVAEQWRFEMEKLTLDKTGYEAISAAIEAHYKFCQRTPKSFKAFYILWFESIGVKGEIHEIVVNIHNRRLSDVTRWINLAQDSGDLSSELDAESIAHYFLTFMFGIVYQWLIDPHQRKDTRQLHEQLKLTMQFLLELPSKNKP